MSSGRDLVAIGVGSVALGVILAVAAAAAAPDEFAELGPFLLRRRLPAFSAVVLGATALAGVGASWLRRSGRGGELAPAAWIAAVLLTPIVVLVAWMIFGSAGDF